MKLTNWAECDWNEIGTLYERNGILRSERNNHNEWKNHITWMLRSIWAERKKAITMLWMSERFMSGMERERSGAWTVHLSISRRLTLKNIMKLTNWQSERNVIGTKLERFMSGTEFLRSERNNHNERKNPITWMLRSIWAERKKGNHNVMNEWTLYEWNGTWAQRNGTEQSGAWKANLSIVLNCSVGDLKPGVPGSIPSRGTMVMVECPWARHIF